MPKKLLDNLDTTGKMNEITEMTKSRFCHNVKHMFWPKFAVEATHTLGWLPKGLTKANEGK